MDTQQIEGCPVEFGQLRQMVLRTGCYQPRGPSVTSNPDPPTLTLTLLRLTHTLTTYYLHTTYHTQVQCHIQDCIAHATVQWGFRYLKLDFLYVAALSDSHQSYHDRTLTRAQAMQLGLSTVTTAMGPNVFLLGCGAPIGSAIGRVHANRVSADAGLSWLPG